VSAIHSFHLQSGDGRLTLPPKLVLHRRAEESEDLILLKILGYLLLYRERLQVEPRLHDRDIHLVPHLLQMDFELHPALWAECGECEARRLKKIAIKVPDAEIWLLRESPEAASELLRLMEKQKLRRNRYNIVGFDPDMFEELRAHLKPRNEVFWVGAGFDPPGMSFDFNGLWFEAPFTHLKF